MKKAAIIIGLILPLQVVALEYRNLGLMYTDGPFNPSESAGISLLTTIGAVEGNPDGTFRPSRSLNRAEFLKIALASSPKVRVSSSDASNCFPDVARDAWYSKYICIAKKRGMVGGYPDGEFKPGRPVNYAEALKILSELYDYVAYSADDEEWYAGYVRAAQFNKTALPSSIKYDRAITRGQMARLAAAYRAHEEGELETYRLAEKSLNLVIAKEIAARVQEEVEVAEEEEEEEEIVEVVVHSSATAHEFPAKSTFLMLGSREIIASGFFRPRSESVVIRNVTVKFREEPKNVRSLYLTDEEGTRIAELSPDTFDQYDKTWKAQQEAITDYIIPVAGKTLGIEAVLQDASVGFPEELIQVKWMSVNTSPMGQEDAYQILATDTAYPSHQTAKAHITSVRNNRPPVIDLGEGDSVLLGEFEISGEYLDGAELRINHLTFTIEQKRGVLLSNFSLSAVHSTQTSSCSLGDGKFINCLDIPAAVGVIENDSILVQLRGRLDIDDTEDNPQMQIDLQNPGRISTSVESGEMGHLRWTDGQGAYNWIELPAPVAEGSVWK
ncbi:MAG: S-layer homology domain-containing protein [Candidatus Peribacter sp.]|nr:S-layer homology domain-containing protein [Candidatus Peribacter sp.]MBT4393459.1 S-layer homology domain-containing protein [Candidatus Peribacter sp.]MBT4600570.1 S-layer homology domain-containing protein [Candidatus Peribacter sp.]MBT5149465.1 S-layer homology domain-containing protein [Candidatus Peribacter sp.]MBT5638595.1 S-layer homology domain-containing protein [Candidatus Peribacter sp.]